MSLCNSAPSTPREKSLLAACAAGALMASLVVPLRAHAQQPGETKIPKIGKIRGGDIRQAFTGKVQSLDTKLKVLNLKAEKGTSTEIFPLKKNVDVQSAEGKKQALSDLKPGTSVVVFYDMKGSQRTIKKIIVLSHDSEEVKKKSSPPS
jgi:hypothetical protein